MSTTANIGTLDRILRAVLGLALLVIGFATLPGVWSWVAIAAGVVALGTSLLRVCPLYTVLGITTCPRDRRPA